MDVILKVLYVLSSAHLEKECLNVSLLDQKLYV